MKLIEPVLGDEELDLMRQCLSSGWVTQGPFVQRFEELFARRHDVLHALACTSCTTALHLAMLALGIKPGDEVLVPAFTWITTANAVEYVGARPVFVDVDPVTFNMDPALLERALTPRTRAILPVHLFGLAAPMDAVDAVARRHGLAVIGDAACAVGTTHDGRSVAALGDVACFSFHPRKTITTGEGGMLTTNDPALAGRLATLRNHGASAPPQEDAGRPWGMGTFDTLGYNFRMCDVLAAMGTAQMARLDSLLDERARLAAVYDQLLAQVEDMAVPSSPAPCGHAYQSYVVRVLRGGRCRRNALMACLEQRGIQSRPGTHAVHRLGYYARKYGLRCQDFPQASLCEDTSIALPMFHGMQREQQEEVCRCLVLGLAEFAA